MECSGHGEDGRALGSGIRKVGMTGRGLVEGEAGGEVGWLVERSRNGGGKGGKDEFAPESR